MTTEIELDVSALRTMVPRGYHRLRWGSTSVPVLYHRGTNDVWILIFHGAVDQSLRSIPKYQSFLPDLMDCHQLSIADPTLELDPSLRSGWYLGGPKMPLQKELTELFQALFKLSGAKRRIYLGGSSGGFAALYYSLCDSGSTCVAVNPQTNLSTYRPKAITNYLRWAWNSAASFDQIKDYVISDLPAAYGVDFKNMVIYLQSTGDTLHFHTQMPNFVQTAVKRPENFILNCGYWGVPGHSSSIPSRVYYDWVRAVVASPWFDRQAILDTHNALSERSISPMAYSALSQLSAKPLKDYRLADVLREYNLRQPVGGLI